MHLKEKGFKVDRRVSGEIKKNRWEIHGENVAEESSAKDNVNANTFGIIYVDKDHVLTADEVLNKICWTCVDQVFNLKLTKWNLNNIERDVHGTDLRVEWVRSHVVFTEEMSVVRPRHDDAVFRPFEYVNVVLFCQLRPFKGEIL